MKFLEEIAKEILNIKDVRLDQLTIVFPNRRAGLFFQKYLAEEIDKPIWSPRVMNIVDFIKSTTNLIVPDRMNLVYELYKVFTKASGSKEPFDNFYFWGETLLRDFDEIDKFLVDPASLLSNLADIKDIEQLATYLSEDQQKLIHSFWGAFNNKHSKQQKNFLSIWNILHQVYKRFRTDLDDRTLAYDGMIYRKVAEEMQAGSFKDPYHTVVFAGFNALSLSEEKIITWYVQNRNARVFWDADDYYLKDSGQEAGRFMREIQTRNDALSKTFKKSYGNRFTVPDGKKITLIGTPLKTGQAQVASGLLDNIKRKTGQDFSEEQTALILPDEKLLFPVLNALPESIDKVNITMGFPLKHSLVYGFVENLIELQMTKANNGHVFHYKPVLAILQHPFITYLDIDHVETVIDKIKSHNKIYVSVKEIHGDHELLKQIFMAQENVQAMIEYIRHLLIKLSETDPGPLQEEFLIHYYTLFNRLNDFINKSNLVLNEQSFLKLFRQLLMVYKLPFEGEPLEGLQIMGAMETRNLDFDQVIVFSVNDGILPPARPAASFIPFGLRRAFNLPVFDEQQAMYAYLFYRMIQRARKVYLIYDTTDDKGMSGDISRFVKQMEFELKTTLQIDHQIVSPPVPAYAERNLIITKNREMIMRLNRYTTQNQQNDKWLTPSALNTYQECNLRFYYRYILGLDEREEVQEDMDPILFGQIFHSVMELAYTPHNREGNRLVKASDVSQIKKQLNSITEQAFMLYLDKGKHEKSYKFSGQHIIIREIVKKMAGKVLDYDLKYAPFEILGLEVDPGKQNRMDLSINRNNQQINVRIGGFIDRIDRRGDVIRILDYKTGIDKRTFGDIDSLFHIGENPNPTRNKAAFQTFLYGLIYKHAYPAFNGKIEAGIIGVRELYQKKFTYLLSGRPDGNKSYLIEDITPYLQSFEDKLQELLEEIFSFEGHFYQTEDVKKCRFCPFKELCKR